MAALAQRSASSSRLVVTVLLHRVFHNNIRAACFGTAGSRQHTPDRCRCHGLAWRAAGQSFFLSSVSPFPSPPLFPIGPTAGTWEIARVRGLGVPVSG